MSKQVLCYYRTSTEGQKEENTIETQKLKVREFAAKNEFEIIGEYSDDGISGASLTGRDGLRQLLETLPTTKAECVLIYKLDRLARTLNLQEGLLLEFNKHKKQLISTLEPDLDSNDPFRKAFRQMLGVFAEFEKAMIVLRMDAGKDRAVKEGRWHGGRIYGYDNQAGRLVINQEEAEVIRKIFRLRKKKNSYKKIAGILSEMNKPTKRDSTTWWPSSVKQIATNPIYKKGYVMYKGVKYQSLSERIA